MDTKIVCSFVVLGIMLLGCALGEPEPGSDVVSQEIERGGNCRGHCRRLCRRRNPRPGHQRRDCRKACRIDCDASVAQTHVRQDDDDFNDVDMPESYREDEDFIPEALARDTEEDTEEDRDDGSDEQNLGELGPDAVSQRSGNCRGHCRKLCKRRHPRPGHQRRDCRRQCRIDCDASVAQTHVRQDE